MKIAPYSSLAAFLAHYHALKSTPSRGPDDQRLFAEMSAAIATLAPAARAALDSSKAGADANRHRRRAELQLRRVLVARGIVAG